jgi:hypothetical protein
MIGLSRLKRAGEHGLAIVATVLTGFGGPSPHTLLRHCLCSLCLAGTGELPLLDGFGLDPIASPSGGQRGGKMGRLGLGFPRFGSCGTETPPLLR